MSVCVGSFTDSEIIVMLGENGTGKTTFIRMLAGLLKSDEAVKAEEEGKTRDTHAESFLSDGLALPQEILFARRSWVFLN